MRSFVPTLILLSCLLCTPFFTPAAQADSLHIVTLYSPPLAYERNGRVTGFATDVVREGLRRMGHTAHIEITPWTRAVFMTRFGEADALFYAIRNSEREQWFHYPEEFLVEETTILLKRAAEDIEIRKDKRDYPNIRLGIGRGYYYGPNLEQFIETSTFRSVEEATTIEMNFDKLLEKRIDVFLADRHLVEYFIRKHASQGLVRPILDDDGEPLIMDSSRAYLAFSRETMSQEMADEFSRVLTEMKRDGTYEHILDGYR